MAKRIVTTKTEPTVEPVVEDKIVSKSLNKDNQIAPTKKVGSFVPVSNVELPKTPEYYKYLADIPTDYNLHNIDVEAYKPYMPGGNVYSFDESLLNDIRAENQGLGEKIWRSSANPINLAWNVGTGIIEGFTLLPELPDLFNGGDFSNEIVEGLRSTRNLPSRTINSALGIEDTNIYDTTENASKVFAPTSAKWWLETGGGLIESIAEFAALGSTIGGAVGKGASLLSKLGKVGSASGKFMNVVSKIGGQVLTSGALSFVESAMSAKSVYDDVYQYQLAKTGDANIAKEIASKSAANTARINMLLTMPTNMTGVAGFLRNADDIAGAVNKQIGKALINSKTGAEMIDALGNAVNKIATKKTIAGAVVPEALQEYWEEDMNMVAEYSGRRKGGLEDASKYSSWLNGAVDKIFSTEGLMNGVLGAIGGIGQTAAVELSPVYKKFDSQGNLIQDDKKGFIGNRESLLQRENRLKAEFAFNKVENLKNDIKTIVDTQKELELNVDENGIKDEAKQDMLLNKLANITAINSVLDGTASNLKQVYKNIANLSNTGNKVVEQLQSKATALAEELNIAIKENRTSGEIQAIKDQIDNTKKELSKEENRTDAMRNGVSKGINEDGTIDDNYVKLANKKIADIDKFQKDYDDIRNQFKFTDLEELSQLPRMIMEKKVEEYLQEDYINKLKEKQSKPLNQFLLEYSNKLKEEGKTDDANALLKKLTTDEDIKKEEDKLNTIQKDLVTLLTPSKRKELVKEYKRQDEERKAAIAAWEKQKQDEATNDVIKKLKEEADTVYTKSIEDDKNKSKDDYSKKVTGIDNKLDFYKDKLKLAETELEKLKKDDKTPEGTIKGTEKYIETVKDNIKRLNKDRSDISQEDKSERESITKYLENNGYISDKIPTDSVLSDKKQYSSADVVNILSTGAGRKELKQIRDNKETNIKGKKEKPKEEKKPDTKKKEEPKQQKTYSDVELTPDFISKYPESEILVKLPETLLRNPLYKNLINWVNKIDGVVIPTIFDNVRQGKVDFAALDVDNKNFDIVKVGEYKGKPGIITVAKKGMTVVLSKDGKQHLLFDINDVSYSGLITVKDAIANGFEAADEIQNAILETTNVPHIEQDIIMQHKGENEVNVYVPALDMFVKDDGKGNLIATGFGKEKVFNNILSDIKEGSKVVVRLLTDSEVASSNKELQDRYKKYKDDKNNTPVVIEYTDIDGNTNRVAYLNEELYLDREISIVDALQDNELIDEVELLINTINSIDVENINSVLKVFDKTFISNFNGIINKIKSDTTFKRFLDYNDTKLLQRELKHLKRLFDYSESTEFSDIINNLTAWKTKMIQDKETGKLMRNTLDYLRKNGKQAKLVSEVSKKANGSIIFINDSKDYITVGDSFGLDDVGLQNLEIAVAKDKGTLVNMETGEYIPINYNGKFTKGIYYVKVPGTNIYTPLLHNTVGDNPSALKALVKNIKRLHELSQVKDDSNKDKWIAIKDEINTIVYQGTTKDGKTYFNVNNENVQFGTNTLFFKDADGNWRDGVRTPLILRQLGEKGKEDIEIFLDDFSQVEDKLKEVRLSVDKKNFKNNKVTYLKTRFKTNVGKLLVADGKDAKGNIIYKRIGNLNPVGKYSTLINLKHTPVNERFQVRSVEAQQIENELIELNKVNKGITTLEQVRRIVNLIDEKYDNLFNAIKDIPVKISNVESNATMQYGNVIEIDGEKTKVITIYLKNIPKADTALPMFDRTTGRRFTAEEYMQRTLLHEILHPIIVDNAKTNPTFNNRILQFRNDFEEAYNNDKGIWDNIFGDNKIISEILKKDINGNIQFDELIAYALTDVRVAKALNAYNSKQKGKTLWNELLDIFLDFLNYFGIVPREGSMLQELQSILSDSFQYKNFSVTRPTSLEEDFDESYLSIVETETKIQQLIQSGEIVFTDENNNPC